MREWLRNNSFLVWIVVVAILIVGVSQLVLVKKEPVTTTGEPLTNVAARPTPTPTPTYRFAIGDMVADEHQTPDQPFRLPVCPEWEIISATKLEDCLYETRSYDAYVVEVTGTPTEFPIGKFWPVKVLQSSSVYGEGEATYTPEGGWLVKVNDLLILPRPNIKVGDRGYPNYNFLARKSPAGEPLIGSQGDYLYVFTGSKVEVVSGLTFADNHWWCQVKVLSAVGEPSEASWLYQLSLPPTWIYCELTKVN
ncbi:MAG TPA: hypothetical protein VIH52_00365 [Candidatus Nanoarchaeia archaeon]|nr:hypothetical protein [uncultured archaeon]